MMVVGDGGNLLLLMDAIIVVLVQQLSLTSMLVLMDVNTM